MQFEIMNFEKLVEEVEAQSMLRVQIETFSPKHYAVGIGKIKMFEKGFNLVKPDLGSHLAMRKIEFTKFYLKGKLFNPHQPQMAMALHSRDPKEVKFAYNLNGNYVYFQRTDTTPIRISESNHVYIYTEEKWQDGIRRYWWTVKANTLVGVTKEEMRGEFEFTPYLSLH